MTLAMTEAKDGVIDQKKTNPSVTGEDGNVNGGHAQNGSPSIDGEVKNLNGDSQKMTSKIEDREGDEKPIAAVPSSNTRKRDSKKNKIAKNNAIINPTSQQPAPVHAPSFGHHQHQFISGHPSAMGVNGFGMYGMFRGGVSAAPHHGLVSGQFNDGNLAAGMHAANAVRGGPMNAITATSGRGGGVSTFHHQQQQQQQQQRQQQQALAARQQAMVAQQQQRFTGSGSTDFQGLMSMGLESADQSSTMMNNTMGFGGPYGQAGSHTANIANSQFSNPVQSGAGGGGGTSLFDQGYNFARSEMALARHQVALNNNAALMAAGGQSGFHQFGNPAALHGMQAAAVAKPYGNYGSAADPSSLIGGAMRSSHLGGTNPSMVVASARQQQHLTTIPAIQMAQHRNAIQRKSLIDNLPERKDGSFPVVLYQETDEHKLTAYQCLLRKQLELFEANEDDVRCSTRQGRTAPIKLGQVGLRCRHCAGVQLAARTKGAAYYSQTIEGIYQIAQNMSKVHLCERCYRIPRDVRRQLILLRSDCRRAIGGKEYWSDNIRSLGIYVDEGILKVKHAVEAKQKEGGNDKAKSDNVKMVVDGESNKGDSEDEKKGSDEFTSEKAQECSAKEGKKSSEEVPHAVCCDKGSNSKTEKEADELTKNDVTANEMSTTDKNNNCDQKDEFQADKEEQTKETDDASNLTLDI